MGSLVQSEGSGGWATGFAFDSENTKIFMTGTTFAEGFWGIDIAADQETDCFVVVGDNEGWTRKAYERPSSCTGGGVVVEHDGYGVGVIMGPNDNNDGANQPILQTVDYYQGYMTEGFAQPYNLPPMTFPVASYGGTAANNDEGFVYIGLHDINDNVLEFSSSESKLTTLLMYWSNIINGNVKAPHVMKMNVFDGTVQFQKTLELSEGQAMITSIAQAGNYMVVGGYTNGSGHPAYSNSTTGQGDMDGFVAFFDKDTGDFSHSKRVESQDYKDDFVNALCVYQNQLYIVGTTHGRIEGIHSDGAFILEMDLDTGSTLWLKQVHSDVPSLDATACAISQSAIYIGGTTGQDLMSSSFEYKPVPAKDVFITSLDRVTGDRLWTQQLDTSLNEGDTREDFLVDIIINNQGNPHILINSMNPFMALNDVFVLDLQSSDGSNDLMEQVLSDEQVTGDMTLGNDLGGGGSNSGIPVDDGANGAFVPSKQAREESGSKTMFVAIFVPLSIAIVVFIVQWARHRTDIETISKAEKNQENKKEEEAVEEPEHEVL